VLNVELYYWCTQAILDGLQRCVLDFTNRLHCAELERHELRTRLSQLLQNADGEVRHHSVSKTRTAAGKVLITECNCVFVKSYD